jgi:hypothetical protein
MYVFLESEDSGVQQQQQEQRSSNSEQQQRPWPLPLPLEQTASTNDSGTAVGNAPEGKITTVTHAYIYYIKCMFL